jgi:hypothetical protein
MATFTGSPNFTATGTGAATRPAADVMDEFVFAANFSGYDETGVSNSAAAIMAADAVARSRNRELILTGTPRITQTLTLSDPTSWRMQGSHIKAGFDTDAYIIKDAGLSGPAIRIRPGASGTVLDGVCIHGEAGNTGDGFLIESNEIKLLECAATYMGRDGCRIGSATTNENANNFRLVGFRGGYNYGDGLHIDDPSSGATDANTGLVEGAVLNFNGANGLYMNNAKYGTAFVGCLYEGNGTLGTGYGIYLDSNASQNVFLGGDVEGNATGEIYEATPFWNTFFSVIRLGVRYDNFAQNGGFTPTIVGTTSAGAGIYTVQNGYYAVTGRLCHFYAEVGWSAHSGTGNLHIAGLPFVGNSFTATMPSFVPVSIYSTSITLAAGAQLTGGYNHNIHQVRVYTSNAGAQAQLPMQTSGTIFVSGSFIPIVPE